MMLERALYGLITAGIQEVLADVSVLQRFLVEEALLEEAEATKVVEYFQTATPSVVHGYARSDNKFPLYAIILTGDNQDQKFLGDEGAFHDDPEDEDFGADDFAAVFAYQISIVVYAQNPDIVLYYYHLLRMIILGGIDTLKKVEFFDITLSGSDLAPDMSTMPNGLFQRRLAVSAKRQFTQPRLSTKLGRAWKIQSVHISAAGAVGEDTGGVQTHVTFPDEEED